MLAQKTIGNIFLAGAIALTFLFQNNLQALASDADTACFCYYSNGYCRVSSADSETDVGEFADVCEMICSAGFEALGYEPDEYDITEYAAADYADKLAACETAQDDCNLECDNDYTSCYSGCGDDACTEACSATAQTCTEYCDGTVSSGSSIVSDGSSSAAATVVAPAPLYNPIGMTDVPSIIGNVIKAILGLSGSIALLVFVWGGIQLLTSGGSPKRIDQGKKSIQWASIGLAVMLAAYFMVQTLISVLSAGTV